MRLIGHLVNITGLLPNWKDVFENCLGSSPGSATTQNSSLIEAHRGEFHCVFKYCIWVNKREGRFKEDKFEMCPPWSTTAII